MCVCVCVCQAHEKMKRKTEVVWPPTSGVWSICPLAHVLKCVHGFTDSTTFMWLMNVLHLINDVYCFVASLMGCCLLGKLQRRWRVSMMVNCSCSTHTQLVPVKPVKWGVRNAVHCCLFFFTSFFMPDIRPKTHIASLDLPRLSQMRNVYFFVPAKMYSMMNEASRNRPRRAQRVSEENHTSLEKELGR